AGGFRRVKVLETAADSDLNAGLGRAGRSVRRQADHDRDRSDQDNDERSPHSNQQLTQRWVFFAPSFSSSAIVSGNGGTRCTGPCAMSTVVCPVRLPAFTSAPFETRYSISALSPRDAA